MSELSVRFDFMYKKTKNILILWVLLLTTYFGILQYARWNPRIVPKNVDTSLSQSIPKSNSGIILFSFTEWTAYEHGLVHGKALSWDIHAELMYFKDTMLHGDKNLGRPAYSYITYRAKQYIPFIPKAYLEEMQGIADGAEVDFLDVLVINTYDDLLNITWCSSMQMPQGGLSKEFIQARNLDYNFPILAKTKVILKYPNYVSVGFPGYIGVLTGMNNTGITLSSHTAYSREKTIVWPPSGLLYRSILENGTSLNQIQEILKQAQRTISNNLMIGSSTENSGFVAEFDGSSIDFRSSTQTWGILVSTNHYLTNTLKQKENINTTSSVGRYQQYFDLIQKKKTLDIGSIQEILSYTGVTENEKIGWNSIANGGTVQSVILLPQSNRLFIAIWTVPPVTNGGYEEILIEDFR